MTERHTNTKRMLLRVEEVAHTRGIGRSKTYELIASGSIESVTIGKSRRVTHEALNKFVESLVAERDPELVDAD